MVIEFAAGVESREDDLEHAFFGDGMFIDGDAASVVGHGHGATLFVECDADFFGVTVHGFVDGVVEDFPEEVMETGFSGGTDIHSGTQSDGFKTF